VRGPSLEERARCHAALGDPIRLGIVEDLVPSDRTSFELQERFGLASNALAYHLDVLEQAGLITRCRSTGDRRRRYICLVPSALPEPPARPLGTGAALFICTRNSARSQLAAALWRQLTENRALSAGTHPAARIHRGAIAAGHRAGLELSDARTRALDEVAELPELIVTVCDRAHEELAPEHEWLHWSLPDPVEVGTASAFDATVRALRERITRLADDAA
jgi:protein-tyrosine-phosphatase